MVNKSILGTVVIINLGLINPTVAQVPNLFNTNDPAVFLRGESRGCQGCNLMGSDLSNRNMSGLRLRQANLQNVNMSNSNFEGAHFTCANLSNANLENAKFPFGNFVNANLTGANLRGADLNRTDLTGAIIDVNSLAGVNLTGARLWDGATIYNPSINLNQITRREPSAEWQARCNNQ